MYVPFCQNIGRGFHKLQTNSWCLDDAPWVMLKIEITLKLFYLRLWNWARAWNHGKAHWEYSSMKCLAVHLTLCLYWLCHSNEEIPSALSHRAAPRWRLLTLSFRLTASWVPLWITYDQSRLTLSCTLSSGLHMLGCGVLPIEGV